MFFHSIILTIATAIIVISAIYKYYRCHTFWQRQGIKARYVPDFGWMREPMHEFFYREAKKFGNIFGIYGIGNSFLIMNDPKIAREISTKEFHKFPIRWGNYFGKTSVILSLVFIQDYDAWKRIRAIAAPAFTSAKLKAMITPINNISNNFVNNLKKHAENGEMFDMKIYTNALAMDVIASCGFGIELNSINEYNHPLVKHALRIMNVDFTFSMIICMVFPSLGRFLDFDPVDRKSAKFFDDLTFKIIEDRLKRKNQQKKDLIGLLVEQTVNDNSESNEIDKKEQKLKGISHKEIAGQVIGFFLAGYDTTNVALCHIIYYLIKHPEWQDKLYEELSTHDSSLDYESLRNLPILNGVIYETLRLKPPVNYIPRYTNKDTTLLNTGIKIPAKTTILSHPYIIHRMPEYFPDPESFQPERFMGEKSMESSIAYMPFGLGNRFCVGMRFALIELRAAVAHLILNYRLLPDPNLKLDYYKGHFILSPKQLMIRIAKR
ncbi:Cytochrome P450 3A4 [Dermatophagoides pteronyssinus]|uniref:Cytochrome P450 3A4 n=1 Tax=Dermatophagoides pteronyssinus TaxID=6956 RepID=A0ABQ8J7Q0_DERPT|nr:Cytochrome P450 3A4 [Dermatophagoides pteronyssinus]